MFKLLDSFDITANFWEVNKQLKVVEPFASLWKEDKSKDKSHSSRIMWGVALAYDADSKYINYSEVDRKKIIAKDWLLDKDFKWKDYSKLTEAYQEMFVNEALRTKREFENKLAERRVLINSTEYNLENIKFLDEIVCNTEKLIKILVYLNKELEHSTTEAVTHGGTEESATEKNLI